MDKIINPIDLILDENNNDNIVLYNEKDEPIEFEQMAVIPLEERLFVILKPAKLLDGISEDEAFVFEIVEAGTEDATIYLVEDNNLIDRIFNEYKDLYNSVNR